MISLKELLTKEIEEILKAPDLFGSVIRYYSLIYAGGHTVKGCSSSARMYFRRLQIDGITTQKKQEMAKYQLKKEVGSIRFSNQVYNSSTITDEIAVAIIKEFPTQAQSFIIKEDEPKETIKETLISKAAELGIETEGLSVKKLKDAIADKELTYRDELILSAIDNGIVNADELTIEELIKALG